MIEWFLGIRRVEARLAARKAAVEKRSSDLYYKTIGMLTVAWAALEISLDVSNQLMLNRAGGDTIETELPVSLRPKLAFFRKCHERLELMAPFRAEGLAIHAEAARLKDNRHDMIHGFAVRAEFDSPAVVHRFKYLGATGEMVLTNYSLDEISDLTGDITVLARRASGYAHTLFRHFSKEFADDPLG